MPGELVGGVDTAKLIDAITGSEDLDQACKDATYAAVFVPATDGVGRIEGTTDVAIDWRLPTGNPLSSP